MVLPLESKNKKYVLEIKALKLIYLSINLNQIEGEEQGGQVPREEQGSDREQIGDGQGPDKGGQEPDKEGKGPDKGQ